MTLELTSGVLRLVRGQTLKVRNGAGSTICAREGALWITEERSSRDVVLKAGQCHRLDKPGLAIVQAFGDAALALS